MVIASLLIYIFRLLKKPFKNSKDFFQTVEDLTDLAIIIPARNEELNMFPLLESLKKAQEFGATIVVVDDHSTDQTSMIAKEFHVHVCEADHRPEHFSGKNWASFCGYQYLKKMPFKGNYVLFTDADTRHDVLLLKKSLSWFKAQKAQLMTARPNHLNPTFWEKILGGFHLLILIITDAYQSSPRVGRFFSIGQYLLFDYEYYAESEGHGHPSVRFELAEDLALARLSFLKNAKFVVCPFSSLYSVRMYESFMQFLKGWLRNLRLGMQQSDILTVIESIILIAGLLLSVKSLIAYLIFVVVISFFQKDIGKFSILGALLYPLSTLIFVLLSFIAVISNLLNLPIVWKNRVYLK